MATGYLSRKLKFRFYTKVVVFLRLNRYNNFKTKKFLFECLLTQLLGRSYLGSGISGCKFAVRKRCL